MARAVERDHLNDGDAIGEPRLAAGLNPRPETGEARPRARSENGARRPSRPACRTSHDCDTVNLSLEKELVIEVLGARRVDAGKIDGPFAGDIDPIRSAGVSLGLDLNHQAAVIARSPMLNIVQRPHGHPPIETA